MKKICRNCFNYVDKSDDLCPICHKPTNGKSPREKKEKADKQIKEQKVGKTDKLEMVEVEPSLRGEELVGATQDKKKKVDVRPKWIPKHKRANYKEEKERLKGTHARVKGRHIDVSTISVLQGKVGNNKYKPKTSGAEIDYRQEKLKWWEIYKFADRWLVRRAINKHVKKASYERPKHISYWGLLLLSIFTGFVGGHSFYARNYKRGIVSASLFGLSITMVILMEYFPWFLNFQYSLCALPGLICIMMWVWDIMLILVRRYRFKISKLNFIYSLDVETRSRIHNKYIDVPNWYEYKG